MNITRTQPTNRKIISVAVALLISMSTVKLISETELNKIRTKNKGLEGADMSKTTHAENSGVAGWELGASVRKGYPLGRQRSQIPLREW